MKRYTLVSSCASIRLILCGVFRKIIINFMLPMRLFVQSVIKLLVKKKISITLKCLQIFVIYRHKAEWSLKYAASVEFKSKKILLKVHYAARLPAQQKNFTSHGSKLITHNTPAVFIIPCSPAYTLSSQPTLRHTTNYNNVIPMSPLDYLGFIQRHTPPLLIKDSKLVWVAGSNTDTIGSVCLFVE